MLFVCYPKCSTCMKAKKWLDEKGIEYLMRDIKSGNLYKSMKLKDRLPQMTEEEQIHLLAEDGMLVKRPVLVTDTAVLTGFREKEWEALLG